MEAGAARELRTLEAPPGPPRTMTRRRKPETVCTGHAANLETIIDAAQAGRLALMECRDNSTGETVAVLCAMNPEPDGGASFVPFAAMVNGNPFGRFSPPDPDGGFQP